jgi:sigma-E factor negative regulatory protein RseC
MLETRAVVIQVEGRNAIVQASQVNGCEQCNGKGCGTGKLSRLFCGEQRRFRVENPINAGVGEEVVISVAEGAILHGIGLVYLLPMLLMVMGAMLGNTMIGHPSPGQNDIYAATGAMLGLAAGFVAVKWISSVRAGYQYQPYIARSWREE